MGLPGGQLLDFQKDPENPGMSLNSKDYTDRILLSEDGIATLNPRKGMGMDS